MHLIRDYIEYLKDNPQGYWFKRKLYGWGWTPATKEGWLVMFGYLALVLGIIVCSERQSISLVDDNAALGVIALATIVLIVIIWRTGEPPHWQWGKKYKG